MRGPFRMASRSRPGPSCPPHLLSAPCRAHQVER
jgi:hypothetical protein